MSTNDNGAKADHRLGEGEGFLIFPDQVNTYVADLDDPWEYVWVEFDGIHVKDDLEAAGLTPSSPVYRSRSSELRGHMVEEMRYLVSNRDASPLHLIGHTYLFLDYLLRSVDHPAEQAAGKLQGFYIREAIDFIKEHYQDDITVEDIAGAPASTAATLARSSRRPRASRRSSTSSGTAWPRPPSCSSSRRCRSPRWAAPWATPTSCTSRARSRGRSASPRASGAARTPPCDVCESGTVPDSRPRA